MSQAVWDYCISQLQSDSFSHFFLIKAAVSLQLSIALTIGDLCKRDPTSHKETALVLVKRNQNNSNIALHSFHSAYVLHSSKGHLTFFSAFPTPAKMPLSAQTAAGNLPWLSWWPRGSDWLARERTTFVRHRPQISVSSYVVWYRREKVLLPEGNLSEKNKKPNPEEIRLLGTAEFFMQLSCRKKVSDVLKY